MEILANEQSPLSGPAIGREFIVRCADDLDRGLGWEGEVHLS